MPHATLHKCVVIGLHFCEIKNHIQYLKIWQPWTLRKGNQQQANHYELALRKKKLCCSTKNHSYRALLAADPVLEWQSTRSVSIATRSNEKYLLLHNVKPTSRRLTPGLKHAHMHRHEKTVNTLDICINNRH